MSVFERNEPKTTGQPGRIVCTSAIPASASPTCCASVAGTQTGDIAPMRRNGVTIVGWPRFAYSISAPSMRSS